MQLRYDISIRISQVIWLQISIFLKYLIFQRSKTFFQKDRHKCWIKKIFKKLNKLINLHILKAIVIIKTWGKKL